MCPEQMLLPFLTNMIHCNAGQNRSNTGKDDKAQALAILFSIIPHWEFKSNRMTFEVPKNDISNFMLFNNIATIDEMGWGNNTPVPRITDCYTTSYKSGGGGN